MAFHRLLFFTESLETPFPSDAAHYTAFSAALEVERALARSPRLFRLSGARRQCAGGGSRPHSLPVGARSGKGRTCGAFDGALLRPAAAA